MHQDCIHEEIMSCEFWDFHDDDVTSRGLLGSDVM